MATVEQFPLRFLGGRLCLDFANSIEDRAGDTPVDFLQSYGDLLRWGWQRGLLADGAVSGLLELAVRQPHVAAAALDEALALREALHRVFLALATGGEPVDDDLARLQRAHSAAILHGRLHRVDDVFAWDWTSVSDQLDQLLWPIAHSAIALLTAGDLSRIKVCANPDGCGWLFYDGSKNGSRRWCSMEGCGSQVKMRRQYARRRAAGKVMRDA